MAKLKIERERLEKLGFDFDQALSDFTTAMVFHYSTENKPMPSAHPLVEQAFRHDGYVIVENETELPEADPDSLTNRVTRLEQLMNDINSRLTTQERKT